ncbi:uncharacterized protein LOC129587135 isoform X2 [Paramacrobiotus metropolitanus]|uniref:uncharacterized protein LOC129587135 isoform X2 n=1 Tax=Paramacrobiotus metropolitanus TaxID=2943436 RepID=UPI00244645ED|nr:uncharacterized protein LOC129587135 isoform X2 [Paramacrobiotus metropolitanus]
MKVDDIIQQSLGSREDDKITLKFPHRKDKKIDHKRPSKSQLVYRPRIGENVLVTCEAPTESAQAISWTHHGIAVFGEGKRLVDDGTNNQFYNISYRGRISVFGVLNVSLQSEGEVTCVEESSHLGYKSIVPIKRFRILPKATLAREIFAKPMENLSVREGENLIITCSIRLPLPQHTVNNFHNSIIWRLNDDTHWAPYEEPYWTYYLRKFPSQSALPNHTIDKNITNTHGSTIDYGMLFRFLQQEDSGVIECWFRPDLTNHEWIVQSAQISVHPRKKNTIFS